MVRSSTLLAGSLLLLPPAVMCTPNYFPPPVTGMTKIASKFDDGASLRFKETHICETTPGVKSYSGYIHLPPSVTSGFTKTPGPGMNTFFWFFEARNNPEKAPLAIYLGGGPGSSSVFELAYDNGPCYINDDSNSTRLNTNSFNEHVNMLYIDQPSTVGFSYSALMNGTVDMMTGAESEADFSRGTIKPNETTFVGTFPIQEPGLIPNTTGNGARAMWHFMQNWADTFPSYREDMKLSMWGISYGGFYAPGYLSYFQHQNDKIEQGKLGKARKFNLDTLGIFNGCTDLEFMGPSWPEMAFNNTYQFSVYNATVYKEVKKALFKPDGCLDQIKRCRALGEAGDPHLHGNNNTVNHACGKSIAYCWAQVFGVYDDVGHRGHFDIAHPAQDPTPKNNAVGFFNQAWVQSALGVPLNFTADSVAVETLWLQGTGDMARGDIRPLNQLLKSGVNVAMVFGDRDYRCNWLGAEATALQADYPGADDFHAAGYANLSPDPDNMAHTAGFVRQAGGFSFTRVFQAGHFAPASQPKAVQAIFNRAMGHRDVATGKEVVSDELRTEGPENVFGVTNRLPEKPPLECYQWVMGATCSKRQLKALTEGTAVIKDYYIQDPKPQGC